MVSAFDLFKIGIGPSSSHTMGPMIAARRFRDRLPASAVSVAVELFGSLAWTAKGHGADVAIGLGLLGQQPASVDPGAVPGLIAALRTAGGFTAADGRHIAFDFDSAIALNLSVLKPRHSNAMQFRARDAAGDLAADQVYYSIGGGFVATDEDEAANAPDVRDTASWESAEALLAECRRTGRSIAQLQLDHEVAGRQLDAVENGLDAIAQAMFSAIDRGLRGDGMLPGKLKVRRRARALFESLQRDRLANAARPNETLEWVSAFAIAVNEENACGGRIVTAPTNGAAGIIPAVLRYYRDFHPGYTDQAGREYLLCAAAIGSLIKRNASISGAELGCQGEVGSAASMAAAGLAQLFGGTPEQVENAAEIAMEHHLGMTCDPIGGLVQIPCIERNAFGAVKAIAAASLALRGDGNHRVSLDQVIETMRQTGVDMQSKYKETSKGGLAINVPDC
jgi:L-serine dehydratase